MTMDEPKRWQRKAPSNGAARAYVTLDALQRLRHRARGFSFLPRQPVHSILTGRHASRLRGRGLNFEELRRYVEGDDIRTIDWPATARLGSPYVRVYTEERDRSVLLLVDQRLSMFFGSRRAMKSVAAAEVAALSAWRVTSLGDRVGAIVFSESEVTEIRPQARNGAVPRILETVVRQNRALRAGGETLADPVLFNDALRRAIRLLPHDGLLCLITDSFGADDETVRLVTRIAAHNDVLTVFIHDPMEAALPDMGRVVVAEGPGQIEVDTAARGLRDRFAAGFAERRARIAGFARDHAIPVLPIATDHDVVDQLRDLLGHRVAPSAAERRGARV
ncbi:DUF58 domain-containing protein [Azospirillum brasilense]|uniref:DUF58 domain-containing protein n=1 Tax=Azospirillum argentinense TaxID=2970906 RepID=UPI00190E8FB0|nr:DUF58 domain-containing protein [Azospirillum argentinense]MBK3802957.1 DUF58 domain-containing protein [Azospirillum argentinense]